MAEIKLITVSEIRVLWSSLDKNFTQLKVDPYILRSQQIEIKSLLGEAMYFDMMENLANVNYQNLLDGVDYSYQGNTIFFGGLKPYLAALTYGRIISNINVSVGRASVVDKATEQSTPHDNTIIQARGREATSEGLRLQAEVTQYLDTLRNLYPLYNQRLTGGQENDTSLRMTRVPRHRQR